MYHEQVGNLYDLLGKLHADRASSAPAALRARAKKQVFSAAIPHVDYFFPKFYNAGIDDADFKWCP